MVNIGDVMFQLIYLLAVVIIPVTVTLFLKRRLRQKMKAEQQKIEKYDQIIQNQEAMIEILKKQQ
ncbi:hypothetical protein FZC66_07445 [Priestia megaterium]|nr:hypothetical protein FZC66_07445 [Priestia megaterium]